MSIILKWGTQYTYSITLLHNYMWMRRQNSRYHLKYLQLLFPSACWSNICRLRNSFPQVLLLLALVSIHTLSVTATNMQSLCNRRGSYVGGFPVGHIVSFVTALTGCGNPKRSRKTFLLITQHQGTQTESLSRKRQDTWQAKLKR